MRWEGRASPVAREAWKVRRRESCDQLHALGRSLAARQRGPSRQEPMPEASLCPSGGGGGLEQLSALVAGKSWIQTCLGVEASRAGGWAEHGQQNQGCP